MGSGRAWCCEVTSRYCGGTDGNGQLAAAGVNRENLYRMLSEEGNPRLRSLKEVLEAIGCRTRTAVLRMRMGIAQRRAGRTIPSLIASPPVTVRLNPFGPARRRRGQRQFSQRDRLAH